MKFLRNYFCHLHTVNKHRRLVRRLCFKLGLYWQGIIHDLSKYSPAEFLVGLKYYQGFRSPNMLEREKLGYSSAWLHHKGRNRHHYEYWNDKIDGKYHPVKMPIKYLKEMFCDRLAATKIYKGKNFKNSDPYDYFHKHTDMSRMHKDTAKLLDSRLVVLKYKGEKETLEYINEHYKNKIGQNY